MSTAHHPRDKKDRSVRPQKHDQYKAKGKLREPSVCRECKAVYHKGRWTWGPVPSNAEGIVCPACQRIRDGVPSGVLLLTGEFITQHRDEILGLARNEEARVKAEHPLARIITIEDQAEAPTGVIITTTDPHLARRIGEALHHAHHGTFTCRYEENEDLLRANWQS
jgi:hypothetical protein